MIRFKDLATEMTEKEIKEVLEIIYPYVTYRGYRRKEKEIEVFFELHKKELSCTLLPDIVEDMPEGMILGTEEQYEYKKFMVANFYSELWINNKYNSKE